MGFVHLGRVQVYTSTVVDNPELPVVDMDSGATKDWGSRRSGKSTDDWIFHGDFPMGFLPWDSMFDFMGATAIEIWVLKVGGM